MSKDSMVLEQPLQAGHGAEALDALDQAAGSPKAARPPTRTLVADHALAKAAAGAPAKGYLAGGHKYFYPEDGDPPAPGGADVHLLTCGGMCVRGHWKAEDSRYLGWAPLPKRDQAREERILAARAKRASER